MKVIEPYFSVLTPLDGGLLIQVERAGRTCYKSEGTGFMEDTEKFVRGLIKRGHEAVLEHASVSLRIVCDRGVTHEIVRHRLASYAQESTRYCDYSKGKFGSEIVVIRPCYWDIESEEYKRWYEICLACETYYLKLRQMGATPQEARAVLPNSLKTEIVVTMNLREWRHFLRLRCAPDAHPQMRQIAKLILELFRKRVPVLAEDIPY